MDSIVIQALSSPLFEMAFTLAVVAAALLLLGGLLSFAVFGYKSVFGEGMEDPRETLPEKTQEDDDGLKKGDPDDEWEYY